MIIPRPFCQALISGSQTFAAIQNASSALHSAALEKPGWCAQELPATSCKPVEVGGSLVAGSSTAVAAAPDQLSAMAFSPRGLLAYGAVWAHVNVDDGAPMC